MVVKRIKRVNMKKIINQIKHIKEWTSLIRDIEAPSEEVQLYAVRRNIYAIAHIKNPTKKVQLEVLNQCSKLKNLRILKSIKNPCVEVLRVKNNVVWNFNKKLKED